MTGAMQILSRFMTKTAAIPEEKPKWGTPPLTDLPGEAHPEGLDENQPVGNDAQNTEALKSQFSRASETEAGIAEDLGRNFDHFGDGSRSSKSQLVKNFPQTNSRVYGIMREALRRKLLA